MVWEEIGICFAHIGRSHYWFVSFAIEEAVVDASVLPQEEV